MSSVAIVGKDRHELKLEQTGLFFFQVLGCGWGWALIRGWALVKFSSQQDGRLFEVDADLRLGS